MTAVLTQEETPQPAGFFHARANLRSTRLGLREWRFLEGANEQLQHLVGVLETVGGAQFGTLGDHLVAPQPFRHADDRRAYRVEIDIGPELAFVAHVLQNAVEQVAVLAYTVGQDDFVAVAAYAAGFQGGQELRPARRFAPR